MGQWEWPDELDALLAASDHHHLLLENEHVRVLETVIPGGETTAVHTHRWPNVQYVVSGADFVRRVGDGRWLWIPAPGADRRSHRRLWFGPFLPHSLENVADDELRVIMVELKGGTIETA